MRFRPCMWIFLVVACWTTLADLQSQENEGTPIKSVHLFDLPSGISRAQIEDALGQLNHAILSTGHSEAGYALWEVNQAQVPGYPSIGYPFFMEGMWPSKLAYDEIHEAPAFIAAIEENREVLQAISDASVYSRYQEMGLGGRR
jgi:hypothetical protein